MGGGSLEICPLSPLLSPGIDHLERAVLSSAPLDGHHAPLRRHSVSMPFLPLQFRQFSPVQGKAQLARRRDCTGDRGAVGTQAVALV